MNKELTFAQKVLQYNKTLSSIQLNLPDGFRIINPFTGDSKDVVQNITKAFYEKYYNDNKSRCLILGSSPARHGTAVTGVPFEDAFHIQKETGIAYLFIAHDLSMVKYISDKIGVLHLGHLVETGTTEEIFDNPIHPYTKSLFLNNHPGDYSLFRFYL